MPLAQVCQQHATNQACFICGNRLDFNQSKKALACRTHADDCIACGNQIWNGGALVEVCANDWNCHGAKATQQGECIKCGASA